jgi:two-component system, NtrC family, sensor kinase
MPDDAQTDLRQRVAVLERMLDERTVERDEALVREAVIALDNARLLGELRQRTRELEESLEYQTATSDVLKVISRSTFDLQPVLDTLVETAAGLCDAGQSALAIRSGDLYRFGAAFSLNREWDQMLRTMTFAPGRGSIAGRVALERQPVHIADLAADPEYAVPGAVAIGGMRTSLGVPLLREGEPIGVFVLSRTRVEPFTERQIELVRTFADQAVIAMENARLLTELRESLEQQTATAEVLQVINSSPGELQPVFETMLEKAMRLCEAAFGLMRTYDGQAVRLVASRGLPPRFAEFAANPANQPGAGRAGGAMPRFLAGAHFVHHPDLKEEEAYRSGDPYRVALVELGGARTMLVLPLRKDGAFLGQIAIYRQEVRPYSEKQIALLQNFAAQAVIAMENARLLGELQARTRDLEESLEYQTATSDVLKVISRSTSDVQPVLDTVTETAARLCGADTASILIREGEVYRFMSSSTSAADPEYWAIVRQRTIVPGRDNVAARAALEGRVVHVADVLADPDYAQPETVAAGRRTILGVPLLREGAVLDTINVARKRVEPFTERQIELVRTFADQAVSRSRTPGCSASCRPVRETSKSRSNTRPRRATCSRSSAARLSICNRYWTHWSRPRSGSATAIRPP